MKKNILYIVGLVGMLMMWGCEKEITFKNEDTEPMVVMRSMIESDSTVMVNLSYSRFFLDTGAYTMIDDATVNMWHNGHSCGEGEYLGEGNYGFDVRPRVGDSVYIEVTTVRGEKVSASTCVPKAAKVSDVSVKLIENPPSGEMLDVNFVLNDPINERNYYRVSVTLIDTSYNRYTDEWEIGECGTPCFLTCIDDLLVEKYVDFEPDPAEKEYGSLLFSDIPINGKDYPVRFSVRYCAYPSKERIIGVYAVVESVSEDYFLFRKTTLGYAHNSGDPFAEPIMVHTNVNGGIGYLGATNKILIPLKRLAVNY